MYLSNRKHKSELQEKGVETQQEASTYDNVEEEEKQDETMQQEASELLTM